MTVLAADRGRDAMPVYRLKPIKEEDPNWSCSTYKGPCLVRAGTERKARDFATAEFKSAAQRNPNLTIPTSPWNNPELVECTEIHDMTPGTAPDVEGVVLIPEAGR